MSELRKRASCDTVSMPDELETNDEVHIVVITLRIAPLGLRKHVAACHDRLEHLGSDCVY